jgi:DeoR family glycerol-3-phosphate regulon repressor
MVITNNINVANRMRIYPAFRGGDRRRHRAASSDGGVVGEAAVDFIKQFKVDYAVIGASAIDHDGALLDFDFREVKVAQAIIANARHVILVSDSDQVRAHRAGAHRPSQPGRHLHHRSLRRSPSIRGICRDSDVTLIETAV